MDTVQTADELDVEGEEVAQQEEEELHGEHHRAHVPEVEAHVKRPHEDAPPARDNVQGAAEHRGAEREIGRASCRERV